MKLLFDQNLSHHLVDALSADFPGSAHVRQVGLNSTDDLSVWDYAQRNGYTIVSKDSDFHQRSFLYGHPPKVIWVRIGNATTAQIEAILRRYSGDIRSFGDDPEASFLVLSA